MSFDYLMWIVIFGFLVYFVASMISLIIDSDIPEDINNIDKEDSGRDIR